MLKRLTVAVAALFALGMQAFGAGTMAYSLSQQFDELGKPLAGCKLYLIQAGTTSTPQNGYQDSGLTLVLPNPLTCDAAGRLPQFFLADGSIKVRLTKSNGVNVVTADGILVVGASSGGGGGSPVDPTTILATGDVKARYGAGVLAGFVRMNGRTIGSASSGATERANADAQVLFEYLWNTDSTLAVSGGRGATSIADWTANKIITLPDLRAKTMAGLDGMGNSASARFTTCTTPVNLGGDCGIASDLKTIAQTNLPSYTLPIGSLGISNTLGINDPGHFHTPDRSVNVGAQFSTFVGSSGGNTVGGGANYSTTNNTSTSTTGISISGAVALTGGVSSGGSGAGFGILPPVMLVTFYIKL